jgi:hypothetical protein
MSLFTNEKAAARVTAAFEAFVAKRDLKGGVMKNGGLMQTRYKQALCGRVWSMTIRPQR